MSTEFNFYVLLPGAKFVVPGNRACFLALKAVYRKISQILERIIFRFFFRQIILFIVLPRLHVF